MGIGIKDTPWHIEILGPTDERRHNTRCIYFRHIRQRSGNCSIKGHKCTGSAHCDYYKEKYVPKQPPQNISKISGTCQPRETPAAEDIKKILIGVKVLSPKKEVGEIIDVEGTTLHIKMFNEIPNPIRKVGFSALKNPPIGRWSVVDEDIQKYILYLLEK